MAAWRRGSQGGGEGAARFLVADGYECEQEVGLVAAKLWMHGNGDRGEGEGGRRQRAPRRCWRRCCSLLWLLWARERGEMNGARGGEAHFDQP
jgi:hypothetical protein